jgi:hypothetical protein
LAAEASRAVLEVALATGERTSDPIAVVLPIPVAKQSLVEARDTP